MPLTTSANSAAALDVARNRASKVSLLRSDGAHDLADRAQTHLDRDVLAYIAGLDPLDAVDGYDAVRLASIVQP